MLKRIRRLLRASLRKAGYELLSVQAALPKEVRGDYDRILDGMGRYSFKFLDVKTFLPTTILRAHHLGLQKSAPLDILDIGTGVGYFPVVCRHYGHRVIAVDRDGNEVFKDSTRWLKVDRRAWEISAFTRIPSQGTTFDLVTAFMVNFDRYEPPEYRPWGVAEWDFFLSDIAHNHLKEEGRLVMLLNGHTLTVSSVMENFATKGASLGGGWVDFKSVSALKHAR